MSYVRDTKKPSNKKILTILAILFALTGYGMVVFAVPPIGGYTPGQTLDPLCSPGDTDCLVVVQNFTFDSPLINSAGVISIPAASSGVDGYLLASDWNRFDSKQDSVGVGTSFEYLRGDNTWQTLDTLAVIENGNLYWTNNRFDTRLAITTSIPNLQTVGTITSGIWHGAQITDAYISDSITASNYIPLSQKGVANGVATLDGAGKVPSSQLSSFSLSDTFVVNSEAEMLSLLSAELGDVAIRLDENKSYILTTNDPTNIANWQQIITPLDFVLSVNGQYGAVNLTTTNIPEGLNLYYTDQRVDDYLNTVKGVAGGVASLDANGKIPSSQLGSIILNETHVVVDIPAMLAITGAANGDLAVVTSTSQTYVLADDNDPSNINSWVEIVNGSPVTSVNGQVGTVNLTTTNIAEGSNQYFTNYRARNAFTATGPLTYDAVSGVFGITKANAVNNGYLSAVDWNTFNSKQNALIFGNLTASSNPEITITGGTGAVIGTGLNISIPDASDTVRGLVTTGSQNFAGVKNFIDGISIGDTVASNMFSVGVGGLFQIDSSGNIVRVNNIAYSWPASQGGIDSVLVNDGSGNLSWGTNGLVSLNGLTDATQTFATGTTGTDFGISSSGTIHTFDLPTASAINRGALSSTDWTTFNNKFTLPSLTSGSVLFSNGTTIAQDNANFFWDDTNNRLGLRTSTPGSGAIYIKASGAEVEDGITWSNGARIGYFTAANATIEAVTGGSLMFKSKNQTGLRLSDNSGNQAFSFAMVDQTTTTNQTIVFGGDYSGGYRSVGTTVAGIDRNGSTLSFFANSAVAGSYASFTPNKILSIDGANRRVGIGTTTPSTALEIANGGTLKLGGGTASGQGNILMNSTANATYDTNVTYLGNNSQTMGMIASSTPAFDSANGPSIFLRGNTYGAISGQRGNAGLIAGKPSSPTAGEGELRFLTANALRMVIGYNGNVGIGTTTPSTALEIANGGTLKLGGGMASGQGNIIMNSNASGSYDTNLILLGSTAQTMGFIAGSTAVFDATNGPGMFLRGNTFSAIGSQRGNAGFFAGNPSSPGTGEGQLQFYTGATVLRMVIDKNGNIGFGQSSPTAVLHLKAGTATASTAPLKFTSGTNLTTAEAGAFEYNGSSLFFTRSGTLRAGLLMTDTASPFNTYSQSAKGATAFTSGTDNFLGGQLAGGALTAGSQNVMIGTQAGNLANAGLINTVMIGYFAGQSASGITTGSVFVGSQAGQNGAGSYNSNFIGQLAGFNASSAYHSNLFGYLAGYGISANNVNFFGQNAGYGATLANDTVGIGQNAGRNATGSIESIYLGKNTGYNSTGSGITGDYNIIVGSESGRNLTSGGKNILIGYNLNAQSAATDGQMTIGNLLFGTGIDGTGTTVSTGKIGIGTASPSYRFSVSDTTTAGIVGSFTNSDGTCTLDPGDVSGWSCPSDLNLKKDIETLATGSLDNILALRPVTYRLKNENGSIDPSTGLIAQEVQTIFPKLVKTQIDGTLALNYGGLTPYMISAIQEMNLKITTINNVDTPNTWRDALIAWFENAANGIQKIFAREVHTETLCVGQTCLNETQVQQILQTIGSSVPLQNTPLPSTDPGNSGDNTGNTGTDDSNNTPEETPSDTGSGDTGITDDSGSSGDTGSIPTE